MASVVRYAVVALLVVFALATYVALHEGGHALAGLLFGGTITSWSANFWNFSAHVGIEGEFTPVQRGLISVAGTGTPYLLWVLAMLRLPRHLDAAASWLRLIGSLTVVNTLLAWVVIPFLYMQGHTPGDDATNFLTRTQAPPLLVAGVALAFYLGGWALFLRRAGRPGEIAASLRREAEELGTPAARSTVRAVAAAGAVVVALSLGLNVYLERMSPLGTPPGYTHAATVDLAQADYADEAVHRFTLEADASVSLYFVIRTQQAGTALAEIALAGPAGYRATFLKFGGGFGVGRATVHPRALQLGPGDYEVRYTFPRTPGRIDLFQKMEAPATS
ncbi:MAG: hypothetical protein ACYC4L_07580 [Chloroflexota bacterium]